MFLAKPLGFFRSHVQNAFERRAEWHLHRSGEPLTTLDLGFDHTGGIAPRLSC
jgi:hypothetical protein